MNSFFVFYIKHILYYYDCRGRHRRTVCSAKCYLWLPPGGGSRASGWRSLRNKRRCTHFEIAIYPLPRTLPQTVTPPALDVLLAKLDRCLQHDSRREPFIHGSSRRRPLPVCAIFAVFDCRGGYYPPVYKISLRFIRDAEDVVPYRFGGFLNVMPVGEGSPLPNNNPSVIFLRKCHLPLHKGGVFWFSFYYLVSSLLIVGDDVLGVPFIKISLSFARTTDGRPYGFLRNDE